METVNSVEGLTMKRIFILVFLVTACATEQMIPENQPNRKGVTVSARFEQPTTSTKTVLEDSHVLWEKGDSICVFTIVNANSLTYGFPYRVSNESNGLSNGVFEDVMISQDEEIYACYPTYLGSAYGTTPCFKDSLCLPLPPTQVCRNGSFGPKVNAAVAKEEFEQRVLQFRNVCGLLAIQLTGTSSISYIELISDSDEFLWGQTWIDMTYSTDKGPSILSIEPRMNSSEPQNKLTLKCPEEAKLSKDSPTRFYFAIPPGRLSSGFTVKIWDVEDQSMTLVGAPSEKNTIKRSIITAMPVVEFSPNAVVRDLNAESITIVHENDIFRMPVLEGDNLGWKVFWGDGTASYYREGIEHSYKEIGTHHTIMEVPGAQTIAFEKLSGIISLDLSNIRHEIQ